LAGGGGGVQGRMHSDGVAALSLAFMKMASERSGSPQVRATGDINIDMKKRQIRTSGFKQLQFLS